MSAKPKSRRVLLGAVAATAVFAIAGFAATQAWGQSGGTSTTTTALAAAIAPATTPPATTPPATSPRAPTAPATTGDQLAVAKTAVDLRVDRAVAAIDRVSPGVANDTNLSVAERATIGTDLATLRSGLVGLKTKVDGETTLAGIKADVKAARLAAKGDTAIAAASLYVRGRVASAHIAAVAARVPAIQSKLSALKASGTDVTALENTLSDLQAKVTDAQSKLNGFDAALLLPSPAPPSATQITAARATLKAVHSDVVAIRKDVQSLRQARRSAKGGAVTG